MREIRLNTHSHERVNHQRKIGKRMSVEEKKRKRVDESSEAKPTPEVAGITMNYKQATTKLDQLSAKKRAKKTPFQMKKEAAEAKRKVR